MGLSNPRLLKYNNSPQKSFCRVKSIDFLEFTQRYEVVLWLAKESILGGLGVKFHIDNPINIYGCCDSFAFASQI